MGTTYQRTVTCWRNTYNNQKPYQNVWGIGMRLARWIINWHQLIHFFIYSTNVEHLLYARHLYRHWEYIDQKRKKALSPVSLHWWCTRERDKRSISKKNIVCRRWPNICKKKKPDYEFGEEIGESLNREFRTDLTKKLTCEHGLEGDGRVNHMDNGGRAFWSEIKANEDVQRLELT